MTVGDPPRFVFRPKSLTSTPVTDLLNVTVQLTLAALVGLPVDRLIETTVGAPTTAAVALASLLPLLQLGHH